jgi:hypothetical protein
MWWRTQECDADSLLIPSHTTNKGAERNFRNQPQYDEIGLLLREYINRNDYVD